MILWVIENKPIGGEWSLYEAHEDEETARWILGDLRTRWEGGLRLVQYAPVSTKRGQGRKVNK